MIPRAPDSITRSDLSVAMQVCASLTYDEGAAIVARYREELLQRFKDEYTDTTENSRPSAS